MISVKDIHKQSEEREKKNKEIYNYILGRCFNKIKIASQSRKF